jgi:molybdate/tungstate transport system permease protein
MRQLDRHAAGTDAEIGIGAGIGAGAGSPADLGSPERQRRRRVFPIALGIAGIALVALVALPVLAIVLGTSPGSVTSALGEHDVRWSLWVTVLSALIATGVGLALGVPLAYLLARRHFPGKRVVEGLIDLPIVLPHTAAGVALLVVYGHDGILGRLLAPLGIGFTDALPGIVVAMMFVSVPFLVDSAKEAFAAVDRRYEQVARTLGVSQAMAFWRVALPLAWRGVLAGAVMMWARGISEFGAVVILAYNPKIIPTLVYERFEGFGLKAAEPVALIVIVVALVVFVALRTLLSPRIKERR